MVIIRVYDKVKYHEDNARELFEWMDEKIMEKFNDINAEIMEDVSYRDKHL